MASKRGVKFPIPKPNEPWRSMSSMNTVGRSTTGVVKLQRVAVFVMVDQGPALVHVLDGCAHFTEPDAPRWVFVVAVGGDQPFDALCDRVSTALRMSLVASASR